MFYGGIDVGGTKTICALANDGGEIVNRVQFPTEKTAPEMFFDGCAAKLRELCADAGCDVSDLGGIGMSLPGMVDENGVLLHAPFLDWHGVDVAALMRERTGVGKIMCGNDVNVCGFAEAKRSRCRNFLWLTVSTGIGGAVIVDGKVVSGGNSVAGEFGHLKVEYEKPLRCTCGQYGCVEAHASGSALTALVAEKCESDADYSRIFDERGLSRDAAGCSVLAKEGEEHSLRLFGIVGDYLGRAIAYGVNILNPECVYIGGGMSRSFELLYPHIRRRLRSDAVSFAAETPVMATSLGYDAALIGAIALVI